MPSLRSTVVTILALLLAPLALAQFPSPVNNDTRTPVPGSGHDYINMFSETVDPSNGSLSVHIATPVPPSRGITIPFSFGYSSGGVQQVKVFGTSNGLTSAGWSAPTIGGVVLDSGGWSYRIPELTANQTQAICYINGGGGRTLTTNVWLDYIFTDPSGSRHNLGLANTETLNPDCSYVWNPAPSSVLSGGDDFYGASLNQTTGAVTVAGVDGTVYNFPSTYGGFYFPTAFLPTTIEDRNGNIVTISEGSGGNITQTDTAGRPAVSTSAPAGTNGTVSIYGLSNAYNVTWETTQGSAYGSQYEQIGEGSNDGCNWLTGGNGPSNIVIKSIELPNGTYYSFGYDGNGLINQISYPTGAVVTYTWNTPSSPNGVIFFPDNHGNQTGCGYEYYAPMVMQRTVAFDGVHTALLQIFTYTTAYNTGVTQAIVQTTVYSSNGSTNLGTFKTVYNYAARDFVIPGPDDQVSVATSIPLEQTVQYYDYGQTNLLETVTKGWQDQFRLGCQLETHDGSPLSGTFYSYGPGLSLTDKKEYDYGQISSTSECPQPTQEGPITAPAGATRETAATYLAVGNSSDRPCRVVTKDSSGNKAAETDYFYDGGTSVCGTAGTTSVASANAPIQHDPAYAYSVSPQPARGNATSVTRQCLQSAPACSSGNPTTTYSYDETGQIMSMKDPIGHSTQYSYKDSYSSGTPSGSTNAYLTTITDPLSHSATFMYGYADGQLTSSKDVNNNQVTYYKYNTPPTGCSSADGLDRLSEADFPDGGKTTYCYDDVAPSPTVTTAKLITSGTSISTTTTFDGMGHAVGTQLTDPDGITYTATTYDGTGQKYTATNPYRSTSDSTYGTTTYTNDALGRTKQVAEPDGSSVLTSYSANQTTVTDEAGHQRISLTDALGRLTEVEEPGTGSQGDTTASGTVTIGGSEQAPIPGTQSTGTFDINGPLNSGGTITLYVNGVTVASVTYASGANVGTVTQSLVSAINGNPSSPVTASVEGGGGGLGGGGGGGGGALGQINITSIASGSATDYTMSGTPRPTVFATSSTMTGGQDPIYDTGTVSITIGSFVSGGFTASAPYGNGSTPASIAAALLSGFSASSSPVVASLNGSVISLTTIDAGSSADFQLSAGVSQQPPLRHAFPNPSFTATGSGNTLTGGSNATFGSVPLVTLYTYDALNNLTCAVQKGTDTTAFTTCAAAPSTWRPRSFVYDSLSRLTSSTNPESNTAVTGGTLMPTMYTYDANSNLTSKTVPAQNQQSTATTPISYCYDVDNRLTAKSYSSSSSCASPVATYTYDQTASACYNVGHRTGMTDAAGSESWCYDKMGRVLTDQRTTNGITNSATYTYLPYVDGSINSVTYPSGRVVTYTTGQAERLLTASDSSTSYASGVHYAPQGAIAELVNNSNISSTEIYNNRLQPCWMYTTSGTALPTSSSCTGTATTGNFQDLKYNFAWGAGDNGNVMGITNNRDTTRSQVFTYDALNRLRSANTASTYATSPTRCWGESYGIDGWGNLQALAMLNSQYTGCNQESGFSATASVQNQLPITGNAYDSAGNLGVEMVGGIPYNYTYNAENQVTSVTGLSTTTNYLYDGDGKRAEKTGSKIYWYGPGGEVLDETDTTGSFTNANFSEYIYFGSKRIARRDSSGDVFYYFADHLGTSRTMAQVISGQTTGTLCYDADFYPFGGERAYTNICTQDYKFTGKERDSESGLDNFGARYDSSSMGRFMTPDPLGGGLVNPQTLNKYSYVANNPINFTDPTGLYMCADDAKDAKEHCTSDKDKAFETQRKDALKSDNADVVRGASAYGDPGKDNGVSVAFGDPGAGNSGITSHDIGTDLSNPNGMRANETVTIRDTLTGTDLKDALSHEGSHVADAQAFVNALTPASADYTKNLTKYQTELRAYMVTNSVLSSANEKHAYDCGLAQTCELGAGARDVAGSIDRILARPPYNVTPQNQGSRLYPAFTPPPPAAAVPH